MFSKFFSRIQLARSEERTQLFHIKVLGGLRPHTFRCLKVKHRQLFNIKTEVSVTLWRLFSQAEIAPYWPRFGPIGAFGPNGHREQGPSAQFLYKKIKN